MPNKNNLITGSIELMAVVDGTNGASVTAITNYYQATSANTAPSYTANAQSPGSSWKTNQNSTTWNATNKYLWKVEVSTLTDSNGAVTYKSSAPYIASIYTSDGPRGYSGCIYRRSEWDVGKIYRNDSASTSNGEKFIDVVTVTGADGLTYREFICQMTHKSSEAYKPTVGNALTTQRWTEVNSNVSMRTPFADIAVAIIQYLQTHQIVLTDPDNNGEVYGAFGAESVTNGYPLWFGGETVDDAVFSVDKNGFIDANGARIRGNIMQNFVRITPENLQHYCHQYSFEENESTTGVKETSVIGFIDLYKTGPLVILDSRLSSMADAVIIQLHMPGYPKEGIVPTEEELWLMRSCVNTPIYIYNYMSDDLGWCVSKKQNNGDYNGYCTSLQDSSGKVCKFYVNLFPSTEGLSINKTENPTWVGEILGVAPIGIASAAK